MTKKWLTFAHLVAATALVGACAAAPAASTLPPSPTPAATSPPTASPAATSAPTASGLPTESPGAVVPCAAAPMWQLAYEVEGMDEVEVKCDIRYKNVLDLEATLDLFLPQGTQPSDRLPVVVLVHGNELSDPRQPIRDHWKRDMFTHGLVVAASGMAAVAFDYRGYAHSNVDATAAAQQDVLDLLSYVADNADSLSVDPERLCVWTSSGGAIPGAWAALFGDPQPRCAVVFGGRLGAPAAADRSPDQFVSREMPAFFIAAGRSDSYASGSRTFIERATEAGADLTVREHPGGHGFELASNDHSAAIIADALEFISQHLGDASAEAVVRDFLAAINAGDDQAVQDLVMDGALIFHQQARPQTVGRIVAGFTCAADIVSMSASGDIVNVRLTFTGTRPNATGECDAVGGEDSLVIRVRGEKIASIDDEP